MTPEEEARYMRTSYLQTIRAQSIERTHKDWYIRTLVLSCIQNGATWREVGEALGTSGQAAWKKYRPEAPQKIIPGQGPYHIEHDE